MFYSWQHRLFENGAVAFENGLKSRSMEQALQARVEQLEAKLAKKDEVIAAISSEYVELKKSLGEA